MKTFDPKFTIGAVLVIGIIVLVLVYTRKAHELPNNPAQTGTAQKAGQSIKDARGW